jgi:hypothetical protein
MIKHIVLWKLDELYSESEKIKIRKEFHDKLFSLKNDIPVLVNIEVYMNSEKASATNYDIMLDTVFNTFDDLNTYQVHPAHVKVVEYVKSLRLQRAAIDFMF